MHPPSSGSSPSGWSVVSNAKTTDASSARDAPAKIAAMPTSAAMLQVDAGVREDTLAEPAEQQPHPARRS